MSSNFRSRLFTKMLFCLCFLAATAGFGQNEIILHSFASKPGAIPLAALTADADGNLYGTTIVGGTGNCIKGCGTVFELSRVSGNRWLYQVLYIFRGRDDGSSPKGPLLLDSTGNLYGTTFYGGTLGTLGTGTVFKLSKNPDGSWTESILYRFTGGTDGESPYGGLVADAAGNLYGSTVTGGSGYQLCVNGCGVVFKLSPGSSGWTESVIYSFTGGNDGVGPNGSLIFDRSGNLYGTTTGGGVSQLGTVFELSPDGNGGWTESVIYSFNPTPDANIPFASVISDTDGNLYGTTENGGAYASGAAFRLTPTAGGWTETVIHDFGKGKDGISPWAPLIIDPFGNLYGTTSYGGTGCVSCGTVFRLTLGADGWTERQLYSFQGGVDGNNPLTGLVMGLGGNLYGTTGSGGVTGNGVVYAVKP